MEKKRKINKEYRTRKSEKIANNSELLTIIRKNGRERKNRKQNVADYREADYKCPQTLGKALAKVRKALPAYRPKGKLRFQRLLQKYFHMAFRIKNRDITQVYNMHNLMKLCLNFIIIMI